MVWAIEHMVHQPLWDAMSAESHVALSVMGWTQPEWDRAVGTAGRRASECSGLVRCGERGVGHPDEIPRAVLAFDAVPWAELAPEGRAVSMSLGCDEGGAAHEYSRLGGRAWHALTEAERQVCLSPLVQAMQRTRSSTLRQLARTNPALLPDPGEADFVAAVHDADHAVLHRPSRCRTPGNCNSSWGAKNI